jgi:hypothetical protein
MMTDFSHTLFFFLNKAWMFNKPSSIAALNHTNRGQLVDHLSQTQVAQKLILKPNQNNYDFGHTLSFIILK